MYVYVYTQTQRHRHIISPMASKLWAAESQEEAVMMSPMQGDAAANNRRRRKRSSTSGTISSSKKGFNRGAWTVEEDRKLAEAIEIYGPKRWKSIAVQAGLNRCGKSCRLRWLNYLRPNIKRGNISDQEEDLILRLHKLLGNRWALIAGRIPGRTDNEIKNYWNSHLSKKLKEKEKQVKGGLLTRQRSHHHQQRIIISTAPAGTTTKTTTTTTTTRPAVLQGVVETDKARCGYHGEVEGDHDEEEEEDNSNGMRSTSGTTTDHEDRDPSPKDVIFDVDDFFDFSNENPSSLEWVNNFIELDPSQLYQSIN